MPVARRSTTIPPDSSTMRPASAAPSISEGASNQAVATPSTNRQSVPISVMPGTVGAIPDDLHPDSDHVSRHRSSETSEDGVAEEGGRHAQSSPQDPQE